MIELIAELATAHGGDVALAEDMVAAAVDAGAHTVKIQSYTLAHLNPKDPQFDWLKQAHLDAVAHERIVRACKKAGVRFLSTPFDRESLMMLLALQNGGRIKIASTQAVWTGLAATYIKSWPWGLRPLNYKYPQHCSDEEKRIVFHLTAIPLYPTPMEAVASAPLLDGWSDHTEGTAVCKHMISQGAKVIEAHFCLPGRSRQKPWDKTPEQFREIRDWVDTVETLTTGISQTFRERWSA